MVNSLRPEAIAFAPFELSKAMPQLLRWLADPDVRPWYDEGELTEENLSRRFAAEGDVRQFTIAIEGAPVGYLQVYRLRDEPDYQRQVDVDPEAVSIDLFIGEPAFRNRGWGTEVIRACLERIVFGEMGAPLAMIAPDPKNARAVRSYEKAGFRAVKTVHVVDEEFPENTGDELIMLLPREEFERQDAK